MTGNNQPSKPEQASQDVIFIAPELASTPAWRELDGTKEIWVATASVYAAVKSRLLAAIAGNDDIYLGKYTARDSIGAAIVSQYFILVNDGGTIYRLVANRNNINGSNTEITIDDWSLSIHNLGSDNASLQDQQPAVDMVAYIHIKEQEPVGIELSYEGTDADDYWPNDPERIKDITTAVQRADPLTNAQYEQYQQMFKASLGLITDQPSN